MGDVLQRRWRIVGWVAVLSLAVGCAHMAPPPVPAPAAWMTPVSEVTPVESPAPIGLSEAIALAVTLNPRVLAADARCRREASDAAGAGTWRSPEIRFGYSRGSEDTAGSWAQEETGSSTERSYESASRDGSESETEVNEERQYGYVTETSSSEREGSSSSRTVESGVSRSVFSARSSGTEWSGDSEDGFDVELRVSPPNPWQIRAVKRAARADVYTAEAQRMEEVHDLACRVTEAALRVAFAARMRETAEGFADRVGLLEERLRLAVAAGTASRADYADICLRSSAATGEVAQMGRRRASASRDFHFLTGIPAERLAVEGVGLTALAVATNTPAELAARRPDVLVAQWTAQGAAHRWRESCARRMPWINRVEAGYGWWDGSQSGGERYVESKTATTETTAQRIQTSTRTQSETVTTDNWKTRTGSSTGSENEQGDSLRLESESSGTSGYETSNEHYDGEEWWIGAVVEVPLFEWLSSEQSQRRQAAAAASENARRLLERAKADMTAARASVEGSARRVESERASLAALERNVETLAAPARGQGVEGEVDAVRMERAVCDARIRLLEQELDHALTVLHLYRVSGVLPVAPPDAVGGHSAD